MLRRPTLAGAFLIAAILAVACGDKARPPTSPTERIPDPDREFLAVSGCDEVAAFRCTAAVRRVPDVVVRDVTQEAAWSTSNPVVATIAADGRLTLLSGGAVVITASHQGMTATRQVQVSAARVELQGRVEDFHEWWKKVPGATIEFVQGPNTGRVTVTDASGFYSFSDLWPSLGGQVVRISHPSYRTGDFWPSVWDHRPVNELNPRLTPLVTPPGASTVTDSFRGSLSSFSAACDMPGEDYPCETFRLSTASGKTSLSAELTWSATDDVDLDVIVYDSGVPIARSVSGGTAKDVLNARISGSGPFDMRVIIVSRRGAATFALAVKRTN